MSEVFWGPLSFCVLKHQKFDRKIWVRKQRTYISKHSFVNRTIKLWNQLPAEALATFPYKSLIFRMNYK